MKISVVTVCFNSVDTIEETMLSVLNQTYPDVEYIIIDGGSTDGTVDIIKKYADRLAYWISEPDKGIYDAMNKGIAVASGDYINFMNTGDSFADKKILEKIFSNYNKNSDILYGNVNYTRFGTIQRVVHPRHLETMKEKMPFNHQASFTKLSYMKKHMFDTKFKIYADYNLFYNGLYHDAINFEYLNLVVANYDLGGLSSGNIFSSRECYKVWKCSYLSPRILKHELKLWYYLLTRFKKNAE